jgi:DNA-binding PadR family transcriptional regulator
MSSESITRRYSELECFVLGLVWRYGPCSTYTVRRHLSSSPSTQWSGSAGAIYPLMQRLEKHGLLESMDARRGQRPSRNYSLTAQGRDVLRAWIGPPLPPEAITVAHDPLRARLRFLDLLPAEERRPWVDAAIKALEDVLKNVREWRETSEPGEPLGALITRSGELDVEGRTRWLREARDTL